MADRRVSARNKAWLSIGCAVIALTAALSALAVSEGLYQSLRQRGWSAVSSPAVEGGVSAVVLDRQQQGWVLNQQGFLYRIESQGTLSLPGVRNHGVTAIASDSEGRTAVAYEDEISVSNLQGDWSTTPYKGSISALTFDASGNVWVGDMEGNVGLIDTNAPETEYSVKNEGAAVGPVLALAVTADDRVWAGTTRGLNELNLSDRWLTYTTANGVLPGDSVNALAPNAQGRLPLWAGTDHGLSVLYPNGVWDVYDLDVNVRSLAVDKRGRVWAGTNEGLIVIQMGGARIQYTTSNSSLKNDSINAMVIGRDGRIWVGTSSGLNILDEDAVVPATVVETLSAVRIVCIILTGIVLVVVILFAVWQVGGATHPPRPAPKPEPVVAPKSEPVAAPVAAPALSAASSFITPSDPLAAFLKGRSLVNSGQRAEAVACFLAVFRSGSPELRQQAVSALDQLGEVETF